MFAAPRSETPEVDAKSFWTPAIDDPRAVMEVIEADFARSLERRLAQEKKLSESISRDCNETALERNELRGALAQAQARVAELEKALEMVKTQIVNLPRSSTADSIHRAVEEALKDRA